MDSMKKSISRRFLPGSVQLFRTSTAGTGSGGRIGRTFGPGLGAIDWPLSGFSKPSEYKPENRFSLSKIFSEILRKRIKAG
jgi:hypothetical protein